MLEKSAVSKVLNDSSNVLSEELCQDIAFVLGVPQVPDMFRLLEPFEKFMETAWIQVRMNLLSDEAEDAAASLRGVRLSLVPPQINWRGMYSPGTFEALRNTVRSGYEANPKLLLLVSAWLEGLQGRPIQGNGQAVPGFAGSTGSVAKSKRLGQETPAFENALSVKMLLEEIAREHRFPAVPEDYRQLAAFPEFLRIEWGYLKPCIKSDEYADQKNRLVREAAGLVHDLPLPVHMERLFNSKFEGGTLPEEKKARLIEVLELLRDQLAALILDLNFYRKSFA